MTRKRQFDRSKSEIPTLDIRSASEGIELELTREKRCRFVESSSWKQHFARSGVLILLRETETRTSFETCILRLEKVDKTEHARSMQHVHSPRAITRKRSVSSSLHVTRRTRMHTASNFFYLADTASIFFISLNIVSLHNGFNNKISFWGIIFKEIHLISSSPRFRRVVQIENF